MSDWDVESGESAGAWRLRPVILAAIGVVAAILVQQLIDRPYGYSRPPLEIWRIAVSITIGTGAMAFGFGMERVRLLWATGFALLVGAVAGLIYYWNGGNDGWADIGDWRYASLFLAVAIAVPLFQTARDEGAWRFPYRDVHGHAWTNVVLWFACWMFVGVVFALAWLLAALFDLIGLHFVREMLERHWFAAGLAGAAFGGALGLFRERDRVVRLLQRVVTAVLGVLAPVLGIGLLLFLFALPFTGLGALWQATKATTPILLCCAIGALGLAILPLCVIAAIATGLRIGQYGFTPDRLWALVFVILATAYGVAYLVALLRGRQGWAAKVRPANLHMAFVVAGVALFLATPIFSFNAVSVRDQVARLESGRITPDQFDWAALAFDFGDPGKAALKRLAGSKNVAIADRAKRAAGVNNRYQATDIDQTAKDSEMFDKSLRVLPVGGTVPDGLKSQLTGWRGCDTFRIGTCTLLYRPGETSAVLLKDNCVDRLAGEPPTQGSNSPILSLGASCVTRYRLTGSVWEAVDDGDVVRPDAATRAALKAALAAGGIEIRTVPRRQVFVGDVPVGDPFE
ncbi:MAG: DUF4153 domain-containing protein [Sphingomonas sp.]|uniref:DUF4153 domain-containing protein n=1 Tax=Sphingomonas sp. TaxID=28214 RepID=UPI00356756B2